MQLDTKEDEGEIVRRNFNRDRSPGLSSNALMTRDRAESELMPVVCSISLLYSLP
jgi:hypothetical protein